MTVASRLARAALVGALVASVFATLPGCGRRGAPLPPEDVLPETINDLSARNGEDEIILSWGRPERYSGGSKMSDLGAFKIERAVGGAGAAPYSPLATIEVVDRDRFRQVKNFRYGDGDVSDGVTYRYRIFSVTTDGYLSLASNEVEITRGSNE